MRSPYWRVAYEPHWGNHWLMIGTFGMIANVHPWIAPGTPDTAIFPQTDRYTDIGFDTQYQYQGDNFWITAAGLIYSRISKSECQFRQRIAVNPSNHLNEARAYASLAYGNNNRVVLTGQYFTSWGTLDPTFRGNAT